MLPREVRDKIYGFAMKFNAALPREPLDLSQLRLLLVSHRVHDEAKIAFHRVNEFSLCVEIDYNSVNSDDSVAPENYQVFLDHNGIEDWGKVSRIESMSHEPLQYVQNWSLMIGSISPVWESDLGVTNPKCLLDVTKQACNVLRQCRQIHSLYIEIVGEDEHPDGIKDLLDMIMELRNIRKATVVARNESMRGWYLRPQYARYMARVMALPEGAKAPKYVRVEDEFGRGVDREGIFLRGSARQN